MEQRVVDVAGEQTSRTDFMGRTTTYAYDAMGRMLSRTYPDATSVSFTYTPTGRRATAQDARGTTRYGYDARDRVTSLTYPDGRELDYTYDARGARTGVTAKLNVSSLTTTTTYDAAGRPQRVTDPLGRAYTFDYDAADGRTRATYPNGTVTTYAYDARERLTDLETTLPVAGGPATSIQSYAYTLDAAGRRTRVVEGDGTTRQYGYDSIDRLVSETVAGSLSYGKTFGYDRVGNRLTQTTSGSGAGSVSYGYDARDRLLTENATTYTYDANGNTLTKSGEAAYAWDFDGRMTQAAITGGATATHVYDVDGTRVKTTVAPASGPSTVTNLLADTTGSLSHVVTETDATGALVALYVRVGDELLAAMRPAPGGGWTTRYVHHDALGSVRALTDESGVVADTRGYEAFGTLNVEAGSDPLPYRFAGEAFDATSRLAYHRARWMDARLGRFHGMDEEPGERQQPSTLHRYSYADNDPVSLIDPTGREADLGSVAAIGAIITISATLAGCKSSPSTGTDAGQGTKPANVRGPQRIPDCARNSLTALGYFMLVPWERVELEYVPTSSPILDDGAWGQMAFEGPPYKWTIYLDDSPQSSLRPPNYESLGRLAHELTHVEDTVVGGWTPKGWQQDAQRERWENGYVGSKYESKALATQKAVENVYKSNPIRCQ